MIELTLQDALVKKIKQLLSESRLKNENDEIVPINIYPQHPPARTNKRENGKTGSGPVPYVLVKFIDGGEDFKEGPKKAKFLFVIATYDKEKNYQGYRDAMNIKEKIYQFLKQEPYIDGCELDHPIRWHMPEDSYYPYYFLGIETDWNMPSFIPEDIYT
ncbi:hypothetical protein [Vallitalea guaymasensis]|uniref:hypothetical protein n=1 Tax=Vallitalea guaymasensis TaxID=1185412 RepID=UPI002355D6A1|nr:hypothetical protein [Vallitalea guaymasensis]